MRKALLGALICIISFSSFFSSASVAQRVTLNQDKVEYDLPYPGILPGHPLFFLKNLRDSILEFTTRDTMKKAELYLLLSDKRVAMATLLGRSGKEKQAMAAFLEGEQYALKIPPLIVISKQQGVSPSGDFVQRLKLSNEKHREVAESFLTQFPQGQSESISQILRLNDEMKKKIKPL